MLFYYSSLRYIVIILYPTITAMKRVTLHVENDKYQFFMELMSSLNFVQTEEDQEDSKEEIIENLKQGFREMKYYKEGKVKGTPLKDFLNEL